MLQPLRTYFLITAIFFAHVVFSQSSQRIKATLLPKTHEIAIQQEITYKNTSNDTLDELYLYDWNNAYSNKNTALAKRFAEEFDKSLHLTSEKDRGRTEILSLTDKNSNALDWERTKGDDILKVQLKFPIHPKEEYTLKISYKVKLPNSQFTGYGFTGTNEYNLRYWYITPALYKNGWKLYNNKNLNDLNALNRDIEIEFKYPKQYHLITDLNVIKTNDQDTTYTKQLTGKNRGDIKLYFLKENNFSLYKNKAFDLISNVESKDTSKVAMAMSAERVIKYVDSTLGDYPHKRLLITENDYKREPLYGLNQLPSFLRPFPEKFQYELKLLKTILHAYLNNTLYLDNRKDGWIKDGIETYLLMKYVNTFYKDMKLLGKLSKIWGIRSFRVAQMNFNDQYPYLYMLMARTYSDQPLTSQRDSLIKFNEKIANKYKAGVGLNYLNSYLGNHYVDKKIKEFYTTYKTKDISKSDFEKLLKKDAPKDINWFFDTYANTNKKIDFKIKKLEKTDDSIFVTLKNKRHTNVPITLYGINENDSVVFKNWYANIKNNKTVSVPRKGIKRLALNYDRLIPEFNERDNWKSVNGFFSANKKFKFQFLKDAEDPHYNQIFYIPVFDFNVYDGIVFGISLRNKTFLTKPFIYEVQPSYAFREKTIVGSAALRYRKYVDYGNMYAIDASISGSSYHYQQGLRYSSITPSLILQFRNKDLRSNERELLNIRFVNILRDYSPKIDTDPDYSVLNVRYVYQNNGIINYKSWFTDFQVASNFAKVSFNWEYRKLFQNNQQLNVRFFAGKFIYNQTNSDYFSYALDRPTDYLFDYDYLGRSESTGIFSQQLIVAEGGFKSKLKNPYANDWIVTTNASFNIWRWIELYGDVGMIKNTHEKIFFAYDSGVRLNLVTDYFELYFPIYSNNGWEISQPQYDKKIRFIVTLSPDTLIKLFTRRWF